MRRKKHKHTRRAIRFYKINFGFRPPYKVLLDGNFARAVDSLKRGDVKELVAKLLGDPVRIFTTKCVMQELRSLGKEFEDVRQICKRYALHKCDHDDGTSAADCLASQLEKNNPEHFFIATQDKALQRQVMSIPGGACLFASVNGLHLETPSEMQKQRVQQVHEKRMAPGAVEAKSKAFKELTEAEIGEQQRNGPIIKRKKAKGPNPLSMRPKQKKPLEQAAPPAAGGGTGEGKKRKRRRKQPDGGATGGNSSDAADE